MIEKYLKDSIVGKERNDKADQIAKMNLLPPRLVKEIRARDSIMHRKDSAYLMAKGYIRLVRDTTGLENDDVETEDLDKIKKEKPGKSKPESDTAAVRNSAILPNEKKKPAAADTVKQNN